MFRPLAAAVALGALLVLPANARAPRLGVPVALEGDWLIKVKAVCWPVDGSPPLKEKSEAIVTLTDVRTGAPSTPSTVTMTGFTVLTAVTPPGFSYGSTTGVRYGNQFFLIGDADFGVIRGSAKIGATGVATSFKVVGHNFDSVGVVDVKIKGTRVVP